MTLNAKQARFVQEYLVDLNATQAAIRAGYSEKTAGVIGHENLIKPEIADAAAKAQAERSERTQIDMDMSDDDVMRAHMLIPEDGMTYAQAARVFQASESTIVREFQKLS